MKEILNRLTNYETLSEKEARDIIIQISEGKLNTSEISSFLTIFMIRNITIDELKGEDGVAVHPESGEVYSGKAYLNFFDGKISLNKDL